MTRSRRAWVAWFSLTAVCIALGVLLVTQLRTQRALWRQQASQDWEFVAAGLIDSNARLRLEIDSLRAQLDELEALEGRGAVLQLLVDEVNNLRVGNGQVGVVGPGIDVHVAVAITVLDLQDLINELRNAGAEALGLNGHRLVTWSAVGSNGANVTVDGEPIELPYRLAAIGDPEALSTAVGRPGGLVELLRQAEGQDAIRIQSRDRISLPVNRQRTQFLYAKPAK